MPVLVMGVCGSGKTSSGSALAALTGGRFLDADSLHTSESIAKMSNGIALTDADREPWLRRLAAELARDEDVVLACSALKARYRALLASMLSPGRGLTVVFLSPTRAALERRTVERQHFMPACMLDSQLAALEPPAADEPAIRSLIRVPAEVVASSEGAGGVAAYVARVLGLVREDELGSSVLDRAMVRPRPHSAHGPSTATTSRRRPSWEHPHAPQLAVRLR